MKNKHAPEVPESRGSFLDRPEAQSNSKLFPLFYLSGLMLPVISGFLFAIVYIGFFPHARTPVVVPCILLPLGLLSAAAGQRLSPRRWEGGVMEVLHIRLAYAALVYLGWAVKYTLAGRPEEFRTDVHASHRSGRAMA